MSKKTAEHSIFTNIEDYVRAKYPEFAQLLEYCKLLDLTKPRPGSSGVTLIVPTDSKYIKEITDLSLSTDATEVGKSCDKLLALMMRKAIMKPADWSADDIADMRYPSQKIVGKATANKVELQHGSRTYATIQPDPGFKVGFRSNIAVWTMTDGRMRDEMDAEAPRKARARTRGAPKKGGEQEISGGYDLERSHVDSARFKVAVVAENEFVAHHTGLRATPGGVHFCPFKSYICSFAHYMQEKHADVFYSCVLPLIHYRTTDFYTIFEPHRAVPQDQYLIHDTYIADWWASFQYASSVPQNIMSFRDWVDAQLKIAGTYAPAAIYTKPAELIEEIDKVRSSMTSALQNPTSAIAAINKTYDDFANTNCIGTLADVFPAPLAEYYRRHPRFKLVHDELAFVIEPLIIRCTAPGKPFDLSKFQNIITIIGNVMHADSIADVERMMPLVNKAKLAIAPDVIMGEIRAFVNSTMFLWIPLSSARIEDYPIESETTRTDGIEAIFNTDLALLLHHKRLFGDQAAGSSAAQELALAALRDVRPEHLSPELLAKIKSLITP